MRQIRKPDRSAKAAGTGRIERIGELAPKAGGTALILITQNFREVYRQLATEATEGIYGERKKRQTAVKQDGGKARR